MTSTFDAALRVTERSEKELLTVLALKDPTFVAIDHLITSYRCAFENLVFLDFENPASKSTEDRLWEAHGKINRRYRSHLAKFHQEGVQRKPVERRKLEKHYLDFIKASTRFYRGYIQRLASHFADLPEVLEIAQKFSLDTPSADPPVQPGPCLRKLIRRSCHATLIRLGDLSRYRETELKLKDRNWGPAIGYYELATTINPSSGASYNQLAVIAVNDEDHLRAVYHLYRALAVNEPHPNGKANLELEFKKISDRKKKQKLIPGLKTWFVCFHAICYKGVEFKEHDELESEILGQLAVDLKERSLDSILNKVCLVNIAAEFLAQARAKEDANPACLKSFNFFQQFNVKTFFTLLQTLLPELERFAIEEDKDTLTGVIPDQEISDRITSVARRILPNLRQYSSWLVSNVSALLAQDDESVALQISEFWKRYAETLTLIVATFPITELPQVPYLLEEDKETLAFEPLQNEFTTARYCDEDHKLKPSSGSDGVDRLHPNQEMLSRIRDLVVDGVYVVMKENDPTGRKVPIVLTDDTRFLYQEAGIPPEPLLGSNGQKSHTQNHSITSINRDDIERAKRQEEFTMAAGDVREDVSEAATASASVSTGMYNMVDELVSAETSDNVTMKSHFPQITHGDSPPTPTMDNFGGGSIPPASSFHQQGTLTPQDFARWTQLSSNFNGPVVAAAPSMDREKTLQPSLRDIWNTPFTAQPQRDERSSTPQSRPVTAHKLLLPDNNNAPASMLPQPPQSSGRLFQEELISRQQQIQMQPSSSSPYHASDLLSSWPYAPQSYAAAAAAAKGGGQQQVLPPAAVPQLQSSSSSSPWQSYARGSQSHDVPRTAPQPALFGAIGQTPPSAQGG